MSEEYVYVKMSKWQLLAVRFLKFLGIGVCIVITLGLFGIFYAGYRLGYHRAKKEVAGK